MTGTTPTRDQIRGQIFAKKADSKLVEFMGASVEVRQPALGESLSAGELTDSEDKKVQTVQMFIQYVYVPGTNERVFEDTDFDNILALPFGADFRRLIDSLNELMGINAQTLEAKAKVAEKSTEE